VDLSRRIDSSLDLLEQLQEQVEGGAVGDGLADRLLENLRDRLEDLRQASSDTDIRLGLLEILVNTKDLDASLVAALHFLMERFDVEAAGMRLREGDDYPYFSTRGFSDEFVVAESSLCQRDANGCPIRDNLGNPLLDCMCGAVIQGRVDPSKPFFTSRGSFWTNSTSQLLATTTEDERTVATRDRCHAEGYESVALLPLRSSDQIFGLIQLNDSREDRFTPPTIALLEDLAELLARVLG
jgi:GAF domain-containing protein